jgi:glycosyltransferase involved in cell wall biosynthesis
VSGTGAGTTLVVPCYTEAARLDQAALRAFVDGRPGLALLLVNDGSTDGTEACLRALAADRPGRIEALSLPANAGKAEAVRQGLRAALGAGANTVGYLDADLSTPTAEMERLLDILDARRAEVVMGARVALLGTDIRRQAARHYLGRVFASIASLVLKTRVYDTQCGAKVFRRSPALAAALETPFRSRWAFDVELLGRLLTGAPGVAATRPEAIIEVPLETWHDVPGSKLKPAAMVAAVKDLTLIGLDLRRRRRDGSG